MARIFSVLAVLALVLLAANFLAGLWIGDFNAAGTSKRQAQQRLAGADRQARMLRDKDLPELAAAREAMTAADAAFRGPRTRMTLHLLLGSAASLVAILVNSITVTYFIGTSRWCREVCETYQLDSRLHLESTKLKRSTFPWALLGIVTIIGIVGLGAAADPSGANHARSASFVTPHYLAALAGLLIVAVSFFVQMQRIAENYAVIERILAEVRRVREAKQLPVEADSAVL